MIGFSSFFSQGVGPSFTFGGSTQTTQTTKPTPLQRPPSGISATTNLPPLTRTLSGFSFTFSLTPTVSFLRGITSASNPTAPGGDDASRSFKRRRLNDGKSLSTGQESFTSNLRSAPSRTERHVRFTEGWKDRSNECGLATPRQGYADGAVPSRKRKKQPSKVLKWQAIDSLTEDLDLTLAAYEWSILQEFEIDLTVVRAGFIEDWTPKPRDRSDPVVELPTLARQAYPPLEHRAWSIVGREKAAAWMASPRANERLQPQTPLVTPSASRGSLMDVIMSDANEAIDSGSGVPNPVPTTISFTLRRTETVVMSMG